MLTAFALCLLMQVPEVTFHCVAPEAKRVQFVGDYTGWDHPEDMKKTADGWTFQAILPKAARIEYKFVVDGKWILDPKAPHIDNGVGGENSVFQGEAYKVVIDDAEPKHPMKRSTLTVDGREVVVFTPERPKGAAILSFADGQEYEARLKVQNVVENAIENHLIRPTVLVLIRPQDRNAEYWGKSAPYEKFFVEDVLPAVRKATGASGRANDVFVGGASLGGVISLRLAEDYPKQIAGGVFSQSGAFQVDANNLISKAALDKLAKTTALWFDFGTFEQDLSQVNQRTLATLDGENRVYGTLTTAEGHTWTAWRHRFTQGLLFLLGRVHAN